MSGTSCDGIDAVAVSMAEGRCSLSAAASVPLGELGEKLYAWSRGEAVTIAELQQTLHAFTLMHEELIRQLLEKIPSNLPDLIVVHGQTLYHQPPVSWQAINLSLLGHKMGCPVVGNLRGADLAHGGQGAPITPAADRILYPGTDRRAILNLGGFSNVTILDGDEVIAGMDVCVCNQLLNQAAQQWLGVAMDQDGAQALQGHCHDQAFQELLTHLQGQRQGRSLGSGDETLAWLTHWQHLSAADALRTITEALALAMVESVQQWNIQRIICAGGGVFNHALMGSLQSVCETNHITLSGSQEVGVDPMWREAAAMAILGYYCAQNQPVTIPTITGVTDPAPLAGDWIFPQGLP